jgi:hypothetical protein
MYYITCMHSSATRQIIVINYTFYYPSQAWLAFTASNHNSEPNNQFFNETHANHFNIPDTPLVIIAHQKAMTVAVLLKGFM